MRSVVVLALLCACGGDDGMAPIVPDPLPTVSLRAEREPLVLAFRLESDPTWQRFTGATTVDIQVAGPYRVAVVCEPVGDLVRVRELARTPDDGDVLDLGCGRDAAPFTVTGDMKQPGVVMLGAQSTSTATGEFELLSRPGVFDLVMLDGDRVAGYTGVAVRRNVAVNGLTFLGDLAQARTPTTMTAVGATNADAAEQLAFASSLDTGATRVPLIEGEVGGAPMVPLLPKAALQYGEQQRVQVSAYRTDAAGRVYRRTVQREAGAGAALKLDLPAALAPVTFDIDPARLVATWSALPPYATLVLRRDSHGMKPRSHELELTRSFVEAVGLGSATLDVRDVPGLAADWQLEPLAVSGFALSFISGETSVAAGEPALGITGV